MSMDRNFRSALSGFNRSDVVNFIEESSIAHEKAIRQLKDENEKLRARVEALEREHETLAVEAAAAPQPEPQPEPQLTPAPEPTAPAGTEETAPAPSESELAAYRRAEAVERAAQRRAAALCREVNGIVENASARFGEAGSGVDTLMQDLSITLRRLTDTFAEFKLAFDDTSDAFRKTELLDESEPKD